MFKFRLTTSNRCKLRYLWASSALFGSIVATAAVIPPPHIAWRQLGTVAGATVNDAQATNQAALACGSLLFWGLLGWLTLGLVFLLATELPGRCGAVARRLSCVLLPGVVRRLACGALSLSLAGGLLAGSAEATAHTGPVTPDAPPVASQDFDWPPHASMPSQATLPEPRDGTAVEEAPPKHAAHTVTVAPGDCLWNIAKRSLGKSATESAVALEWPRWWERNRDVIGHDPNLIHPGQRLESPTPH